MPQINLQGTVLEYQVKRRLRLNYALNLQGRNLEVVAPLGAGVAEIEAMLQEQGPRILAKLRELEAAASAAKPAAAPPAPADSAPRSRPYTKRRLQSELEDNSRLMQIELGGHAIPYQLKHALVQGISLRIRAGLLRVTVPLMYPQADLDAFLQQKSAWILRHLQLTPPPANTPAAHSISLLGQTVAYQLKFSGRKTVGFTIGADGLTVTAPNGMPLPTVEAALRSKQDWIVDKLAQRAAHTPQQEFVWADGVSFPYLGRTLRLQAARGAAQPAHLEGDVLRLQLPGEASPEKLKRRVHTWLQAQAGDYLEKRLAHWAQQMQIGYAGMRLNAARTQWGSCSAQGVIALNWRLIHFDPALVDYVLVHELAHRQEMNHSPRFWAVVGTYFPAYKAAREQLKDASRKLPPGL
ncbi:SprT family zinc-dependent metalloprotease [Massilia sp. W12]|uniref:M48 family metallopeptidase n=1 Tax=Massilia sp. W12 TaxID=3126507 RepID=UPI0030D36844